MKGWTNSLIDTIKKMFVPQKKEASESFESAVKRMQLTEEDLQLKEISLWRLSVLMLTMSVFIWIYAIYQFFEGTWIACVISLVVMMIGLALAYRYHFWYYQIKTRKLGVSFFEWFRQGLLGEKI
jgi:intracellular multiplication protein IcmV